MSKNKKLVCSRCKQEKPTFMFYVNKLSSTGFRSECKSCTTNHKPPADQRRFYSKVRRKSNPEKYAKYDHRARALRLRALSEQYTVDQVLQKFGNRCHLCGQEIDLSAPRKIGLDGWENGLHLDHVIPLSRGGSDMVDNIRPAHGMCNLRKGSST